MLKKLPVISNTLKRVMHLYIESWKLITFFASLQIVLSLFQPDFNALFSFQFSGENQNFASASNWTHMGLYFLVELFLSSSLLLGIYHVYLGENKSIVETCSKVLKKLLSLVVAVTFCMLPAIICCYLVAFFTLPEVEAVFPFKFNLKGFALLLGFGISLIAFYINSVFTILVVIIRPATPISAWSKSWYFVERYWLDTVLLIVFFLGPLYIMQSNFSEFSSDIFTYLVSAPLWNALIVVHFCNIEERLS